jgi:mono/diheme cytochrome c family protein
MLNEGEARIRGEQLSLRSREMKSLKIESSYKPQGISLIVPLIAVLLALSVLAGCDVERRKSDAELGLNPQQAAGRKIYDDHCDRCHRPYSTKGRKGPGLKGLFQHQYLSLSGLPANDDRVADIIRNGRPDMPGFGQVMSTQDIQDLLAYLHTL